MPRASLWGREIKDRNFLCIKHFGNAIFSPFLRLMCHNLVLAQRRRETKGKEGQAARAKTAGRDWLLPCLSWAHVLGMCKDCIDFGRWREKYHYTRRNQAHWTSYWNEFKRAKKPPCNVFGFQSKPHKFDPLTLAKWKSQIHYPGTQGNSSWVQLLGLTPRLHLVDIWWPIATDGALP